MVFFSISNRKIYINGDLLISMEKEYLKNILVDQNEHRVKKDFVFREIISDIEEYRDTPLIVVLSGMRRVGKSTILKLLMQDKRYFKVLFVNFDDFRLVDFKRDDFERLREISESDNFENIMFFDEIQNVEYWERFVRTMHDEGYKLYITGSNATMLSSELGTHLTGRTIVFKVFPYSFREFLMAKGVDVESVYGTKNRVVLEQWFSKYIEMGGIPEYVTYEKEDYLKVVYEDILYRDIVSRYSITNVSALKELLYYLISNIGKEFSYSTLTSITNIKHSTTIKEYIEYFENSYMLITLKKFDYSLKKQLMNPKKVYAIDTGLARAMSFKFSQNRGRELENVVCVELMRRGLEIYYHRNKYECDFVIKKEESIVEAIQVSVSVEDIDTQKREFRGLLDACSSYNLKEGLLLTEHEEREEIREGVRIRILPIWKWLLLENESD